LVLQRSMGVSMKFLMNLLAGLSGMSPVRRLGTAVLVGAMACVLAVSPAFARAPGRASRPARHTVCPRMGSGRRPHASRGSMRRSGRMSERRHHHHHHRHRHHRHRHRHHHHHRGQGSGQDQFPPDSPYGSASGDSGGYPDYAATPGRDSYDDDEDDDDEPDDDDDEGSELQWPLALRILPPGPETTALREHVSSLVAEAERQAADGEADPRLRKALAADVRRLQQLLAERGDLLPVS
jgi:hypothetical protein